MSQQEDAIAREIWGGLGVNPQAFPFYYSLGPETFKDAAGDPTGVKGSEVTLTRDLNNFPHLIFGIRLDTYFDLPPAPTADDVAVYRLVKEYLDKEVTMRFELAQQNIIANSAPAATIVGPKGDVSSWHPFPTPYPAAGGNNVSVVLKRQTSYPAFPSVPNTPIAPQVEVTLVTTNYRGIPQTTRVRRAHGGA